jgi:hypothetical protein
MSEYHKKCPLFGLDLGFTVPILNISFEKKAYTSEEMNDFCGYDTEFDVTTKKCIPKRSLYCESITIESNLDDIAKNEFCKTHACNFEPSSNKCKTVIECYTEGDDAARETACNNNPNCHWDPQEVFKCNPKTRGIFAPTTITENCDQPKVNISDLCGPGTSYNSLSKICIYDR